jgi:hypothetical protein
MGIQTYSSDRRPDLRSVVRMSHVKRLHWTLRSIAGVGLITTGVIATHSSGAEATRNYPPVVESSACHGGHDDDDDDEDDDEDEDDDHGHGHDNSGPGNSYQSNGGSGGGDDHKGGRRNTGKNRGRDDRGRGGHGQVPSNGGSGLQQVVKVSVAATTFLRVDKSGRVTAAATNTGCEPSNNDQVFLFRPNGTIEATFAKIPDCDWSGDFTVSGRFQPQDCRGNKHGRDDKGSSHRDDD